MINIPKSNTSPNENSTELITSSIKSFTLALKSHSFMYLLIKTILKRHSGYIKKNDGKL